MNGQELTACVEFARSAALRAGWLIRKYRRLVLERVYTSRSHFKTAADDEIDRQIVGEEITRRFPDHNVHSEESGSVTKGSRYTWVCDAVDGTINLATGFTDHVAFCLALCEDGVPVLGIVNAALRGEFYEGVRGYGAFLNGQPIDVSAETELAKVLMCTDSGKHDRTANLPHLEKLHGENGITCSMAVGCASVPLALVASGVLHAYLATSLEPEDMAASVAVIRAAGGVVTNLKGEQWRLGDASILAANPILRGKLTELLGIPRR